MNEDTELYVVEAVEVSKHKPLKDQIDDWSTYCVCDSKATADEIIQHDMKTGDILRGRVKLFTLQTKETI